MNHEHATSSSELPSEPTEQGIDIKERFDERGFVEEAPWLDEQLREDRPNRIEYIGGYRSDLGTNTSSEPFRKNRAETTESTGLKELDGFFVLAAEKLPDYREVALSMRENLTYIGEKERQTAAAGIALDWMAQLDENPDLQIVAVAGEIAKGQSKSFQGQVKSDEYLLETILENFSDEQLEKYAGRILLDPAALMATPENTRILLLDDWTISGTQLGNAFIAYARRYPELKDTIEAQLIVSDEEWIQNGLEVYDDNGNEMRLPVTAYYAAHPSEESENGAHITGSHSSVDFDFTSIIIKMCKQLDKAGVTVEIPKLLNIVRPYRYDGVTKDSLGQRKRLEQVIREWKRRTLLS